jgi:hypothetical protein
MVGVTTNEVTPEVSGNEHGVEPLYHSMVVPLPPIAVSVVEVPLQI